MEKVKSESKNIHSKRALFLNIGLVLSLIFCFAAFEFKVYISDEPIDLVPIESPTFISDKAISTVQKPKPKPVIPVKKNKVFTITDEPVAQLSDEPAKDMEIFDLTDLLDEGAPSNEAVSDPTVHVIVESDPKFKGGVEAFYQYLADNVNYPSRDRRMNIEGKVFLEFIIEVDGSLTDIKVVKSISETIDAEAIRVLKATPNWIPGSNRGQPVRVRMTIPINFQLH